MAAMPWLRRLVNTIRSSNLQRDIDREIAFHMRERGAASFQRCGARVE
jgi:hypothetical protein